MFGGLGGRLLRQTEREGERERGVAVYELVKWRVTVAAEQADAAAAEVGVFGWIGTEAAASDR